ncbi:MAG: hypothetical protein ACP5OY_09575, partial [Halothiobacillaceae bacterium]
MDALQRPLRLILLSLALAQPAHPAPCPGAQGEPIPDTPSVWPTLLDELERHDRTCHDDPYYLAYRGALYNLLQRPAQGAADLERALMLQPTLLGAQIDYAQSLTALGQTQAARALIQALLARDDLPPTLRPLLSERLQNLIPPSTQHTWAGYAIGYDTNLNAAPSLQ